LAHDDIETKPPLRWISVSGEIIAHVVWLDFRFPLSLRMVDEMLAARGSVISHETVRQWALKFGRMFAAALRWHVLT
jgi:putative transposase